MKAQKTNKINRVSKDQWLAVALDMLESEGVEAVKIESWSTFSIFGCVNILALSLIILMLKNLTRKNAFLP
jgi:hypothetical protein